MDKALLNYFETFDDAREDLALRDVGRYVRIDVKGYRAWYRTRFRSLDWFDLPDVLTAGRWEQDRTGEYMRCTYRSADFAIPADFILEIFD